jgi:hypothetical protein
MKAGFQTVTWELNVVVKWLILLFRIQEVPGSNLGPKTGYLTGFRGYPQTIQANAGREH